MYNRLIVSLTKTRVVEVRVFHRTECIVDIVRDNTCEILKSWKLRHAEAHDCSLPQTHRVTKVRVAG
jgi:hypothetical protein